MTKNQEAVHIPTASVPGKGDISYIRAPGYQPVPGDADDFTDVVDYIIKITHRIWEEKAIGLIYAYYLHNAVIHTSSGDIYGREAVVAGTVQTLAGFPDRRLYGDDVIWKQEDDGSYYSSHRITHEGHNTGYTEYGPPTGRKVSFGAIADCVIRDNQIVEEWLVRDGLTMLHQLGLDYRETAKRMAQLEDDLGLGDLSVPGEIERLQGQLPPKPLSSNSNSIEDFIRHSFHEIWNWRMLNKVDDYYASSVTCQAPSMRHLYGPGDLKAFILSLLSPFPDLMVTVDHFCALGDEDLGYRTAVRWTMQGTHTGPGVYGKPTGSRIKLIGITHQIVKNRRITQEWTLFDEFALFKQLYASSRE